MEAFIPLLLLFGLMWLLLIRPQKAQLQRHRAFLDSLAVGDEVMTAGGTIGRIVGLDDAESRLEIAPGVVVRVAKARLLAAPGAGPPRDDADDDVADVPTDDDPGPIS